MVVAVGSSHSFLADALPRDLNRSKNNIPHPARYSVSRSKDISALNRVKHANCIIEFALQIQADVCKKLFALNIEIPKFEQ